MKRQLGSSTRDVKESTQTLAKHDSQDNGEKRQRRSQRNTNRLSMPKSAVESQRLTRLFFDEAKTKKDIISFRSLTLQRMHSSPDIYLVENFLSTNELDFLAEQIEKGCFKRSFVDKIQGAEPQQSTYDNEHRTSTFMSFEKRQNSKISAIERRACELLGMWDTNVVEPLQLVRYNKGEFFGRHHDLGDLDDRDGSVNLPPRHPYTKRRLFTIFCYLNDVPEGAGGETFFPYAGKLAVQPKKGRAVVFSNVKMSGCQSYLVPDQRTVHEGKPVTKGKKYGLNIWICER